jgi:hypothetical protein
MNVIRHQAIRMQRAAVLARELSQIGQIHKVIGFDTKARATVYTALNHVKRHTGKDHARSSRHAT